MKRNQRLQPFEHFVEKDTLEKIQETWNAGGLHDQGGSNILDHMCAAAAIGMAMCEKVSPTLVGDTAIVCLIHDAYKLKELKATNAAYGDPRVFDDMAAKQEIFLLDLGWPKKIVMATSYIGHTNLCELYYRRNVPTLGKIAYLADCLTSGDAFPMLETRLEYSRKRYAKIQTEDPLKYGLPEGRTVFGIMEEVAFSILCEFADKCGLQPRSFHKVCAAEANAFLGRLRLAG